MGFDSRSTVHRDDKLLQLRLPWSMVGLADPSSLTALVPVHGTAKGVKIHGIGLTVDIGGGAVPTGRVTGERWQQVRHR